MEKDLICPYQPNTQCRYVDTSVMIMEKECAECELYIKESWWQKFIKKHKNEQIIIHHQTK